MGINTMSDHQESDHFSYDRSWDEIEIMLDRAERVMNMHHSKLHASTRIRKLNFITPVITRH